MNRLASLRSKCSGGATVPIGSACRHDAGQGLEVTRGMIEVRMGKIGKTCVQLGLWLAAFLAALQMTHFFIAACLPSDLDPILQPHLTSSVTITW